MATFELTGPDGGTYHVDAPDERAAIATFSAFHGASAQADKPLDKYQQAAKDDVDAAEKAGVAPTGFMRRIAHGMTLGADSTLLAAAATPAEMIRRGTFSPAEGYDYAKARQDEELDRARANTGALGTAAEIAGGAGSGMGLARGGVTAARFLAPEAGILPRIGAAALDGLGLGGFSGAMEGNGLADRATNAIKGAAAGTIVGGAVPIAGRVLGGIAAPIFANIKARLNPAGFAEGQVARAIHESGASPDALSQSVSQAAAEGQPQFALADAMGNPGQRMLSTVARAPGEGRTAAVDALEGRQANQGRRVANALSEGFGSRMTPDQLRGAMTAERGQIADDAYGAVRDSARPVDVSNAIDHIDANVPTEPAAPDTISGRLQRYRRMLSNGDEENPSNLTDFEHVQRVRSELADEVQTARQGGQGNRARLLGQTLRELDGALEDASDGFRQANRDYAQASQNIDAIDAGRTAALRGRTESTIPAYQALGPRGQQAFRTGYVDPLIEQAQSGAFGVNKARPLTSDAFRDEAAAIAPGNPLMQRRLGREMTMFETRNQALGGSRTADNLNDHAAMSVDPHLVGQIVSGNWHGAVRSVLAAGHNAVSGNTPEVRKAVADILLQNGGNISAQQLRDMVNRTVQRLQFVQNLARGISSSTAGGVAIAGPGQRRSQ